MNEDLQAKLDSHDSQADLNWWDQHYGKLSLLTDSSLGVHYFDFFSFL